MRHSDPEGLYRALGVSPAADPDEIKNAYRRLAKETHPDTRRMACSNSSSTRSTTPTRSSPTAKRAPATIAASREDSRGHSWLGIQPVNCSRCVRSRRSRVYSTFDRIYQRPLLLLPPADGGHLLHALRPDGLGRASFPPRSSAGGPFPSRLFLTLRAIARNALGGTRDLGPSRKLLWQNSRAFAAQGNRKLSYALARKLTDADDSEIAEGARELVEDMEARGANPKKIKLKDPWRIKPLSGDDASDARRDPAGRHRRRGACRRCRPESEEAQTRRIADRHAAAPSNQ